ncbi:MAG: class I SAM-dependent methyltransferase [Terriglobales bacterium]
MVQFLHRVRAALQGSSGAKTDAAPRQNVGATAAARHSNGLQAFTADWTKVENLRVLDLGATSNANLTFIIGNGHKVYTEDLLREARNPVYQRPTEKGMALDPEAFLAATLQYPAASFDRILLWDLPDYLPELLVKPLVARLDAILRPGGSVLAYFHTRDAGPGAPFCRYHIRDAQTLEMRPGEAFPLQRIFNNRHVENLFRDYHSIKFFLARDNLREVLVTK